MVVKRAVGDIWGRIAFALVEMTVLMPLHLHRPRFLVTAILALAVLVPLVRTSSSTAEAASTPDCSAVASNLTALGLAPQARTSSEGYGYTTWTGKVPAWDGI